MILLSYNIQKYSSSLGPEVNKILLRGSEDNQSRKSNDKSQNIVLKPIGFIIIKSPNSEDNN